MTDHLIDTTIDLRVRGTVALAHLAATYRSIDAEQPWPDGLMKFLDAYEAALPVLDEVLRIGVPRETPVGEADGSLVIMAGDLTADLVIHDPVGRLLHIIDEDSDDFDMVLLGFDTEEGGRAVRLWGQCPDMPEGTMTKIDLEAIVQVEVVR
jgi:hypothetical protein